MKEQILNEARLLIGKFLKERRQSKNITFEQITKTHGLEKNTCLLIENGVFDYTINDLLTYISAIDCYFYFADKDGKHLDFKDMTDKM